MEKKIESCKVVLSHDLKPLSGENKKPNNYCSQFFKVPLGGFRGLI